jgi:hypothetical protein
MQRLRWSASKSFSPILEPTGWRRGEEMAWVERRVEGDGWLVGGSWIGEGDEISL